MKYLKMPITFPETVAQHFLWAGPLTARLITGYVFMMSGWNKLNNLEGITKAFELWGIPCPEILTPFVSGWEFIGGLFLIIGFLTRISAGGMAVIMVVAILSVQLSEVSSLNEFLGLPESTYFAVFAWLAITGAGHVSIDVLMEKNRLLE